MIDIDDINEQTVREFRYSCPARTALYVHSLSGCIAEPQLPETFFGLPLKYDANIPKDCMWIVGANGKILGEFRFPTEGEHESA